MAKLPKEMPLPPGHPAVDGRPRQQGGGDYGGERLDAVDWKCPVLGEW